MATPSPSDDLQVEKDQRPLVRELEITNKTFIVDYDSYTPR